MGALVLEAGRLESAENPRATHLTHVEEHFSRFGLIELPIDILNRTIAAGGLFATFDGTMTGQMSGIRLLHAGALFLIKGSHKLLLLDKTQLDLSPLKALCKFKGRPILPLDVFELVSV